MGTSRTKMGRPGRERFFKYRLGTFEFFSQYPFLYDERVEFPTHGE
jgi:hypothetical protein